MSTFVRVGVTLWVLLVAWTSSADAALADGGPDGATLPDAADSAAPVAPENEKTEPLAPSASTPLPLPPHLSIVSATPAPSASAAPLATASAAPSASAALAADPAAGSPVRIHERKVFVLQVPRGGQTAAQRATNATQALEHAVDDTDAREVRIDDKGDVAIVFLGDIPIVQLGPDDATAEGDSSVSVHAKAVASKVQSAVTAERKRSALATTVFSISLLVFSALIAFLALGRASDLVNKARTFIEAHPERIPNLNFRGIEVIRPAALRGGVLVAIDASKWVLRLGAAYVWVLFALSLFEATRVYSERLTGFVFSPLSGLMGRAASALPVLLVFAVAGLAVALLVRFVALFFGSVARGETSLPWLPADLAPPTSVLVRAGIVLVALTFAAPLVTGSDEGSLARAGAIALIAVALSVTPMLATTAVGAAVVFGRKLKVGHFAEVGGRYGMVRGVSLFEVSLEDERGSEVRVPHLASLLHATRLLGPHPPIPVEITVGPGHASPKVRDLLETEASRVAAGAKVSLDWVDASGAGYTVLVHSADFAIRTVLLVALAEALAQEGIPLGHPHASNGTARGEGRR